LNLDAVKQLKVVIDEDDDYKLVVTFNRLEREFSSESRTLLLYADVHYSTNSFVWDATVPAVRIPYKDPAMGFLLNGVVFSSVGIYQRAPGVVVSHDTEESATGGERLDIVTSRNSTFSLAYRRNGINIIFRRGGKEKAVPIGVFMKAFSGLPYDVLLKRFAFKPSSLLNSFPCEVSTRSVDLAKADAYGLDGTDEPSVDDCINMVYKAIMNFEVKEGAATPRYSSHWKLGRIRAFLDGMRFKSEQNYETVLSLHSRAIGTYLDQDLKLPIFVVDENGRRSVSEFTLSRGTFIDESIAAQLRWYDIERLRVKTTRSFLLQEESPYLFRAKGYALLNDIVDVGLRAGQILGEKELQQLNHSSLKMLEVETPEGKKVITRSGADLDIGDLYTMLNTLFTCGYKTLNESSQYELANRIVIDYDRQVILEVEQTYSDIANSVCGCQELSNIAQSLPRLPSIRLCEHLRDTSNKELAQAEITNVMSRAIAEGRTSALMRETPAAMTQIQVGQYGRVDSLHSPESDKVGSVQELTAMARVNPQTGEIEAPYEKVVDGKPTGVIEYISAAKERNKYIVGWDDKLDKEIVMARYNGDVTTVARESVDFRDASPFCDMSISRATIPFPEFSQPRRSLMASKMTGQAIPLLFPERPLISTGADFEVPCLYYTARDIITGELGAKAIVEGEQLELINVEWEKSLAYYTCLYNGSSFVYSIPFTATDKETLYNYNLNYKPGNRYGLDDIVFFNQSCDIRQYDTKEFVEQGTLPFVGDTRRPSLALGVNLRVMFKTYMSSTIDDGLVISDRLIKNRKFSSIQLFHYEYELKSGESFNQYQGVPRLHTYVYEGMPVITFLRTTTSGVKEKYIKAEQFGEVVVSNINEREGTAEVWVATFHDAQLGDKACGRHGNKSVIARIVPEADMPYDPETGETADIVCSPLGIPSRMNNGQLVEATMGACAAAGGYHAVVTPFYPGIKETVQDMYKQCGFHKKHLFLPRFGKFTERPVFLGNVYFLKLEQMSNLKWAAVGSPRAVDPVFGQPIESSTESKGQAVSEMETWAMIAAGAKTTLNSLFSLYSTDGSSRKRYFDALNANDEGSDGNGWDESIGDALQVKVDNKDALVTQTVMRMFGQDLVTEDDVHFLYLPLRMDDIVAEVTLADLKNHQEGFSDSEWCKVRLVSPIVNPFWIRNFPLNVVLGVKSVQTLVDQKHYLDVYTRETYPEKEVSDTQKVKYLTGIEAVIALLRNTTIDEAIDRLSGNKGAADLQKQGNIVDVIEAGDEDKGEQGYVEVISDLKETAPTYTVPTELADIVRFLQKMKDHGMELRDLVWEYVPIMPKVFRQTTVIRGQEHEHSFQKQLRHVCECSKGQDAYRAFEQFIGYSKGRTDELISFRGYFFGKGSQSGQHGKVRSSVLSKRVGFSGRTVIIPATDPEMSPFFIGIPWRVAMIELCDILCIRLMKRADKMCRDLIQNMDVSIGFLETLSEPQWRDIIRSLGEYNDYIFGKTFPGLDKDDRIYVFNYLREQVRKICEGNVDAQGKVYADKVWMYPEDVPTGKTIDCAVVAVGRQPTLHKKSIRIFFMKLVDGYCTRIHPTVCNGYNADFDGDTMWNLQMLGEMKNEGWKTMSVLQDLIAERDGAYTLTLAQDNSLGLYCASIYKHNAKRFTGERGAYYIYDSKEALKLDLEYGTLHYYDVVVFTAESGDQYISTAGRILINAVIPGAMTKVPFDDACGICAQVLGPEFIPGFKKLKYDCPLVTTNIVSEGHEKGAKIANILLDTYRAYGARESVYTTQALYEIGLVASDIYSVTASMDDMSVDVDVQSFMGAPREYVSKLNTLEQLGLVSEEERKSSSVRAWERVRKQAMKAVVAAIPEDSDIHYLLYSGARGKPDQIMQSVGFIGTISKTVQQDIEYPILHGYGNGLTSLDLFQACYPTRIGVVSTQAGTKDTGYSTRQTVYMSSGMEVVENDCGITNWITDVEYDAGKTQVVHENGEVSSVDSLIGAFVDPANGQYVTVMHLLSRSGYVITEDILQRLLSLGYAQLYLMDETVTLKHGLSEQWREQAVQEGYSYALPYTDNFKVTEKTVDWIEKHGLRQVIMYGEDTHVSGECFEKEAYLPVEYDSTKYKLLDGENAVSEELLFGQKVLQSSEGFKYYERLLDKGGLFTLRALRYLTEKQLRVIEFDGGRTIRVKYEITSLFRQLVTGCYGVGMLYLDADGAVTADTLNYVEKHQLYAMPVRSDLTCLSKTGVCALCHGKSLTTGDMAEVGENLGIAAAQAQCEPLSQSTLNVTHSGGKRDAGIGLVSGLGYYMKMLQGRLVSKKTAHLLEGFSSNAGYVKRNQHDPRFFQIVEADGHILENWKLEDADSCCVADGAYIDAGTRVKAGLPQLDRYAGRDIFKAALKTRYLLLKEYYRIFSSLNVSPKTYALLAREQTSICYLDEDLSLPVSKDCCEEIENPTGAYILRVSPQCDVVNKYSGIAGFAFEDVASMILSGVLDSQGLKLNSALGNLVTGTTVGSRKATFIPRQYGQTAAHYSKSAVKRLDDALSQVNTGQYSWSVALDTQLPQGQSMANVNSLTDAMVAELRALADGDEAEVQALNEGTRMDDDIAPPDDLGDIDFGFDSGIGEVHGFALPGGSKEAEDSVVLDEGSDSESVLDVEVVQVEEDVPEEAASVLEVEVATVEEDEFDEPVEPKSKTPGSSEGIKGAGSIGRIQL